MRDEREWVPVEVLWDERAPEEETQRRERPIVRAADPWQLDRRPRRERTFHDDAHETIDRFGPGRRRDEPRQRKHRGRFEDFEDDY